MILLSLGACDTARRGASPESAFLHRLFDIGQRNSATGARAASYCLSVLGDAGQADPTADLMAMFEGRDPPVVVGSECGRRGGVVLRSTGQRALLFVLESVRYNADSSRAFVAGGWYGEGLEGEGYECQLERQRDVWIVKDCEMAWIS